MADTELASNGLPRDVEKKGTRPWNDSDGYRDTHITEKHEVKKNEADTGEIGLPLGWEGVEVVV